MSHAPNAGRIPLRLPSASATFAIAIAGYLGVNLSPYMITALEVSIGVDFITAGWIVTGVLLATAIVGLSVAPLCAGRSRLSVARGGLLLGVLAFGAAALVPSPAVIIAGLLIGGAGAGGAVAASGAAFAAFINPDRVAGFNGLANRAVITVVLAVLPVLGLAPINVFGALALFSLIGLVLSAWLPQVPVGGPQAATCDRRGRADARRPHGGAVRRPPGDHCRFHPAGRLRAVGRDRGFAVGHGRGARRIAGRGDPGRPGPGAQRCHRRRADRLGPADDRRRQARPRRAVGHPDAARQRPENRHRVRHRPHRVHRPVHRLEHRLRRRVHVLRGGVRGALGRRPLVRPVAGRLPGRLQPDPDHRRSLAGMARQPRLHHFPWRLEHAAGRPDGCRRSARHPPVPRPVRVRPGGSRRMLLAK